MDTPQEQPAKKRFVVKIHFDQMQGIHRRDVFIDDELFEYEIDQESLLQAKKMGPGYLIAARRDIERHFLESLSDFIGRKVTEDDVKEAIQTGWI